MNQAQARVVVIGAGIGGLTAAASLARSGMDVTVLEAHVYPGGCAGTFYNRGYRFDAGATLAGGFYPGGPMDRLAEWLGIPTWEAEPAAPAMVVHMPDGSSITRWGDDRRWEEYRHAFGSSAEAFFHWQERRADALWDLALRLPAWPPQTGNQLVQLLSKGTAWLLDAPSRNANPGLFADAFQPVSNHLHGMPDALRLFVDAQLLISAQATSQSTNALYGAAALDLPRRGVVHLRGGMDAVANKLVDAVRTHGGRVLFRKEITRIILINGKVTGVETRTGEFFPAEVVIANLPEENIQRLTGELLPEESPYDQVPAPKQGWGAFVLYVGLDDRAISSELPLHHQILRGEPLGEGNSVFLSISPAWDESRAPAGKRAITLSTHTDLRPWWDLFLRDRPAYEARIHDYQRRLLDAARTAIPHFEPAAELVLPGTPVTF